MPDDRDTGTPAPTGLASAAVELLRVPLSGFVTERKRLAVAARDDGDDDLATAILALRKPSVAAWALNALTAHRPDLLGELEQLGSALGDAQRYGDAAALRTLGAERRSLIATLVTATVEAAAAEGASLSGAVIETVRQSLQAASADADLAAQVSSGRLTDAPTSSGAGWGGVVGGAGTPGRRSTADGSVGTRGDGDGDHSHDDDDDRRRRLRARLEAAERDEEAASSASEETIAFLDESAVRRAGLQRDREDLARRLEELDADIADADREWARRQREADRAQRTSDAAREDVERLRSALED
ncbi:hypothetical protein SAMN06295974_3457 [Plantibacter flavus]|uniref:Uncharacterized protein n=1 Tax=Plantibacter flavus TaxID=150123 RepID=A0A3N2C6J9_9MICO|nr:hypothetical protein [Plantibacter flavus]ROR83137.1 hypothetical protein EDD42_3241 [Plantibacter flavus]SMG46090.1 hypothetical protein SAMN06295974_3457 [Plantibacter flavus]